MGKSESHVIIVKGRGLRALPSSALVGVPGSCAQRLGWLVLPAKLRTPWAFPDRKSPLGLDCATLLALPIQGARVLRCSQGDRVSSTVNTK